MLRLTLKPGEFFYIGRSRVLVPTQSIYKVYIDGDEPILREQDVIAPEDAHTPLEQLHLVLQEFYLIGETDERHQRYRALVQSVRDTAMSEPVIELLDSIEALVADKDHYKAIRAISRARRSATSEEAQP